MFSRAEEVINHRVTEKRRTHRVLKSHDEDSVRSLRLLWLGGKKPFESALFPNAVETPANPDEPKIRHAGSYNGVAFLHATNRLTRRELFDFTRCLDLRDGTSIGPRRRR